jgi:hypothetical protein
MRDRVLVRVHYASLSLSACVLAASVGIGTRNLSTQSEARWRAACGARVVVADVGERGAKVAAAMANDLVVISS